MTYIEQVLGNTFCIVTPSMRIPFYRLGGGEAVLLDSGLNQEGEALLAALEQVDLRVRAVLTTHGHYDHIGNHIRLRRHFGAELWMSLFDAGVTQTPLTLQACFYADPVKTLELEYPFMTFQPDRLILPQEKSICIDGAEFQVVCLPGHAHAQLGFITPDQTAYLGDALISPKALESMPLLFAQNISQALESTERIASMDCRMFILAHNGVYTNMGEIVAANRAYLARQAALVAMAAQNWSSRGQVLSAVCETAVHHCSVARLRTLERIVSSTLFYLEETGRLELRCCGGEILYRATRAEWPADGKKC